MGPQSFTSFRSSVFSLISPQQRDMKTLTAKEMRAILTDHFNGFLCYGKHKDEDHKCCAVELLSHVQQHERLTDDPLLVSSLPATIALNDSFTDDELRTESMLPLLEVTQDYSTWSREPRRKVGD